MTRLLKQCLGLFIPVLLANCTMLRPDYETPSVTINAFRMLPVSSSVPQFEIDLHIINPNRVALELIGISYTISIEEHKLLSGVSSRLPVIAAYAEGNVTVTAVPDVLASINLIADLVRVRRNTVNYNVQMKLDVGNFLPAVTVDKAGEISLMGSNQW